MKLTRDTLIVGGLVLAAMFLGSWIVALFPTAASVTDRPFERLATVGAPIDLRTGKLKVTAVSSTTRLMIPKSDTVTTEGTFIVMRYQFTPLSESRHPTTLIAIDSKGRRFQGSPVGGLCGTTLPGIASVCTLVVEVARDATGLRLEVPAQYHRTADDVAVFVDARISVRQSVTLEPGRLATAEDLQ